MKTTKKVILSIAVPFALILALLVTTTLHGAMASDVLDTIVVITESDSVQTGQVLAGATHSRGIRVERQDGRNFRRGRNSVTALDMYTFHKADSSRKTEIRDILADEFENDKMIVFFAEEESIHSSDVYNMLGVAPEYALSSHTGVISPGGTDDHANGLIGMSVERQDGINAFNYFFDDNNTLKSTDEKLEWIANNSSFDNTLVGTQSGEMNGISTQLTVQGNGYNDNTSISTYFSVQGDWQASTSMYLRRTNINDANKNNIKTTWQGTSVLCVVKRPGCTPDTQISTVNVKNEVHSSLNGLVIDTASAEPQSSVNTTGETVGISFAVSSNKSINFSVTDSKTRTQADIQITKSFASDKKSVSWKYKFQDNSNVAKNGGANQVQQISFTNETASNARFSITVDATFTTPSGCGAATSGGLDNIAQRTFYCEATDMVA